MNNVSMDDGNYSRTKYDIKSLATSSQPVLGYNSLDALTSYLSAHVYCKSGVSVCDTRCISYTRNDVYPHARVYVPGDRNWKSELGRDQTSRQHGTDVTHLFRILTIQMNIEPVVCQLAMRQG